MGDLPENIHRNQLTELFLSQTPLLDIPWKDALSLKDVQNQRLLLQWTVCHKMGQTFPVNAEYKRKFLKKIIDTLEEDGIELCEDLYNLYVESLENSKTQSSFSYKSYYLSTIDEFIPLFECSSFLSCGTTGLNTWPGARFLANWCIHHKDLFFNKRIIELGAGVGLTGIMVTKSCFPVSYLFTDYHEKVLKILNYNVKLNFDQSTQVCNDSDILLNEPLLLPSKYSNGDTVISVDSIDWTEQCGVDAILESYGIFDVILAADVVFEPTLLASLVDTIFRIMNRSHQSKKYCTGYFSIVVRNDETFEKFNVELNSKSFEVTELKNICPNHSNSTHKQNTDVKLLKIVIPTGA